MRSFTRFTIGVLSPLALVALPLGVPAGATGAAVAQRSAVTPKAGTWLGHTRQGEVLSFRVSGNRVSKFKFDWSASCDIGDVTGTTNLAAVKLKIKKGRFVYNGSTATVKGTFTSKRKATGALRVQQRIFNGFDYSTCDTGKVTWTARR